MSEFLESESFVLPSQVKKDVASRLKNSRGVRSLELRLNGDSLSGAKEFAELLRELRGRGVRVTHEVSIKLNFPKTITKERALAVVERLPKPKNGFLKVRLELGETAKAS